MRSFRHPQTVPEAIRHYVVNRGMERRLKESAVHLIWENVVGEQNASHTETLFCRDGKLVVTADSATWAHELSMLRHQIAQKLNSELGGDIIRDIHFQARGKGIKVPGSPPVRRKDLEFAGGMRVLDETLAATELSKEQLQQVESVVSGIRHEELRSLVREALIRERKINAWKRQAGYRECPECLALHNEETELCTGCRLSATC